LDGDAKAVFVEYYNECGASAIAADERQEAAWNKLSGYAARLALVGQLARDPYAEAVTGEVMHEACDLARWFGNEACRIYATLSETGEQRKQRKLREFIESRGDSVTVRDVMQSYRPLRNQKAKTEAELNALAAAGYGNWEPVQHMGAGRPTQKFQLFHASTSTQLGNSHSKTRNSVDVDAAERVQNTPEIEPTEAAITDK
jgi:hypothetical protein